MLPGSPALHPAEQGYRDDSMQVTPGTTPDGRLLLYFAFPPSGAQPYPPAEGDGAAGDARHGRFPDAGA